jgi:predicted RNA-binding protein YlqC (UPF0109 family)
MARLLPDWIKSYLSYTEGTEPPRMIHFFVAVSTIAGALRRHVWIDMKRFKWYPNFYVIIVAPPGIVSKTTTMDHGIDLLKAVPDIKFGPDVITWEALTKKFAESQEEFLYNGEFHPQSAMTLASGEFGNLIDPRNGDMVNLYISLWDGRNAFAKETKMSGNDSINAPWINMIGCTTPHWVAESFPEAMIGGGFVSRCIFVYAEEKDKLIAWPDEMVRDDHEELKQALIHDLEHISQNLLGPITMSAEAREWGRKWYEDLWTTVAKSASTEQLQGYLARKQAHLVKLGAILSIAESDSLIIEAKHYQLAEIMLKQTEKDASKVFGRIGQTVQAANANRLVEFVKRYKEVSYVTAYRHMIPYFPDAHEFAGILQGLVEAKLLKMKVAQDGVGKEMSMLVYTGDQ